MPRAAPPFLSPTQLLLPPIHTMSYSAPPSRNVLLDTCPKPSHLQVQVQVPSPPGSFLQLEHNKNKCGVSLWLTGKEITCQCRRHDSIPDLGRFYIRWSNYACEPQLLSRCCRVREPQLLSPCTATAKAPALRIHAPQ